MGTHNIGDITLILQQGNIVGVEADAIVNAANTGLAGGGGVDGAIHRAGGPSIMAECRTLNGCSTGSAKATTAGNLQARYIFHAVGPVYRSYQNDEAARLLSGAYQACLDLAERYKLRHIAFPSLSTGAYGYPLHLAAPIALQTLLRHLRQPTSLQQITFILFSARDLQVYEKALQRIEKDETKSQDGS